MNLIFVTALRHNLQSEIVRDSIPMACRIPQPIDTQQVVSQWLACELRQAELDFENQTIYDL
jgi:hypothetical protein